VTEVCSVNRKQSDIALAMPDEFEALEARVRDEINKRVSRGRLTVRVSYQLADKRRLTHTRINAPLAKAYAKRLDALAKELRLPRPVPLDAILRIPGVVQPEQGMPDAERCWPATREAVARALDALLAMKTKEGDQLEADLAARVAAMRRAAATIKKHAPEVGKRYQQRLLERIIEAGVPGISPDDERLLKEVVLFADKADISEELTRLESHFKQFDDCRKSAEPVGRMLDFLAQEMNREVNTVGSKANDSLISRAVVMLKTELERFREQVQNVE
jgi:uncharacterized protein (TIGR00255 family)